MSVSSYYYSFRDISGTMADRIAIEVSLEPLGHLVSRSEVRFREFEFASSQHAKNRKIRIPIEITCKLLQILVVRNGKSQNRH